MKWNRQICWKIDKRKKYILGAYKNLWQTRVSIYVFCQDTSFSIWNYFKYKNKIIIIMIEIMFNMQAQDEFLAGM